MIVRIVIEAENACMLRKQVCELLKLGSVTAIQQMLHELRDRRADERAKGAQPAPEDLPDNADPLLLAELLDRREQAGEIGAAVRKLFPQLTSEAIPARGVPAANRSCVWIVRECEQHDRPQVSPGSRCDLAGVVCGLLEELAERRKVEVMASGMEMQHALSTIADVLHERFPHDAPENRADFAMTAIVITRLLHELATRRAQAEKSAP